MHQHAGQGAGGPAASSWPRGLREQVGCHAPNARLDESVQISETALAV